ncbi:hypothetical protein B0H14DRAFT_2933631, partial [Mycena olivaceomarginata]
DLILNQERSGDEAIIFSLETELYEAKTKMEEFAADQEKLRTREAEAAVEIQSLRSKNEEFRMELQDKAEELENLEADIEKLRMDVELQSLKNDELGMQLQGREDELEKVGNAATELLANIEKLKADQRNLRSREAITKASCQRLGASFRKTGTESPNIEKLEADMEKLRTDVELQTLKNDELVMQLQEREDEIQTVGNTATESRADIERLEADRESLQTLEATNEVQLSIIASACNPCSAFRVIRAYINTCQYVGRADVKVQIAGDRQPDIVSWMIGYRSSEVSVEYQDFNGTPFCVFSTPSETFPAHYVRQWPGSRRLAGYTDIMQISADQ